MGKVIDISSKLSKEKPILKVGEKEYKVNNSLEVMMKLQESFTGDFEDISTLEKVIELAIGKTAVKELNIKKESYANYKIIVAGIFAAIQEEESVDEILSRFQSKE